MTTSVYLLPSPLLIARRKPESLTNPTAAGPGTAWRRSQPRPARRRPARRGSARLLLLLLLFPTCHLLGSSGSCRPVRDRLKLPSPPRARVWGRIVRLVCFSKPDDICGITRPEFLWRIWTERRTCPPQRGKCFVWRASFHLWFAYAVGERDGDFSLNDRARRGPRAERQEFVFGNSDDVGHQSLTSVSA